MKRVISAFLAFYMAIALTGCAFFFEDEKLSIKPHSDAEETAQSRSSYISVNSYDELKEALVSFLYDHTELGIVRFSGYGGDPETDLDKACMEVSNDTPIGAYAAYYISGNIRRIVTYYEAEINITYKKEAEQINNLTKIYTVPRMKEELMSVMSSYGSYLAVHAMNDGLTKEAIESYIEEIYYSSSDIMLIPSVSMTFYPENGEHPIIEINFEYPYERSRASILNSLLDYEAKQLSALVADMPEGEALLTLCTALSEMTEYDKSYAMSGQYDRQVSRYNAYGAIVEKRAVGEGFAMAYKLLCDYAGLECTVIIGRYNGIMHAWNIVKLDGHYYHVDVSKCDENGFPDSFLVNDENMDEAYTWDENAYPKCDGILTYSDFVSSAGEQ